MLASVDAKLDLLQLFLLRNLALVETGCEEKVVHSRPLCRSVLLAEADLELHTRLRGVEKAAWLLPPHRAALGRTSNLRIVLRADSEILLLDLLLAH